MTIAKVKDLTSSYLYTKINQAIPNLKLLVLFGSQAKGSATEQSDWDLAFLMWDDPRTLSGWGELALHEELQDVLEINSDRIDLVNLKYCSPLLRYVVAKEGSVLYSTSPFDWNNFQLEAWKGYLDTAYLRQYQEDYIHRTLTQLTTDSSNSDMTSIDRAIATRKLQAIVKYLTTLQPRANLEQETYLNDFEQQLIVERLLHLIIEAAVDTNTHLLVASGFTPPETYYDSFIQAGRGGIITPELAKLLAPSTGLRNRLVHEYDEVNPVIVYQSIKLALELFPKYVEQIQAYLNR